MTQKQVFNLPIEAGIYTEETARGSAPRWHDADKVRFRKGLPEKLGGWVRIEPQFKGKCRKIIDWSSLDGRQWTAIGTDLKLYLWQDSTLYDITPIRRTQLLANNPFSTTIGIDIVTVTDTAHAAQEGDFVRFTGATTVGGLNLNNEYRVLEVLTANTYTIYVGEVALGTATGGGAAVTAEYDISIGLESSTVGNGYGTGTYSSGGYSEPITTSVALIQLRTWSLDTWGEDLMACPFGGSIYWWDRTNGPETRAVVLDDAGTPPFNNYIVVSQTSRQIISLGAYDSVNTRNDPLLIRWCSQEDFNDWTPTTVNTAGDIRVFNGSKLMTGIRARGEILIFTDSSVHSLLSDGANGYGITTLGENISILSPNAAVALDHRVFFMAESDFYLYDGVLRVLPCDVRNHVYEGLTIDQKAKVHCGINRQFNEVWWFYPALPGDIWFDGDFTLSAESVDMRMQPIGDVPLWTEEFWSSLFWSEEFWAEEGAAGLRYKIEYSSTGHIEMTDCAPLGGTYDAIYMMDSGAVIEDFFAVDYDMTFTIAAESDSEFGMAIHITDLSSVEDSFSDNIQAIVIDLNTSNNSLRFRRRTPAGTNASLDNSPLPIILSGLATPITLAAGNKYGLTVRRDGNVISAYLTDYVSDTTQFVTDVTLTGAEQAIYFGGSAGPLFWGLTSDESITNNLQVHSFRVGKLGSMIAEIPDDPGNYTRNTNVEVTRYVLFNYEEGTWSIGTMSRTAWHDRSGVMDKPYAAGADGFLYKHETGVDDDQIAIESYIESYMMEIPDAGEDLMHIDKLIPDFLTLDGSVNIKVRGKKYPQRDETIEKGPFSVNRHTPFISPRMRARQVSLRIESDDIGDNWRSGRWRGRAGAHGKR